GAAKRRASSCRPEGGRASEVAQDLLMRDLLKSIYPWVVFAGSVLIVAVLYWAQVFLVPVGLAVLLSFVLTPVVTPLQRWFGRVPAVLMVTTAVFILLALAGWGLNRQGTRVLDAIPGYRDNSRQRGRDSRGVGRRGSVEKLQKTVEGIQEEFDQDTPASAKVRDPVVTKPLISAGSWFSSSAPLLADLTTEGIVAVLTVFILLESQDLRNRVVGAFGHGHLALTTRALDEAAARVSRYLQRQVLVNLFLGAGV